MTLRGRLRRDPGYAAPRLGGRARTRSLEERALRRWQTQPTLISGTAWLTPRGEVVPMNEHSDIARIFTARERAEAEAEGSNVGLALNAGWVRVRRLHVTLYVELARPLNGAQTRTILEAAEEHERVIVEVRDLSAGGVRSSVSVAGNRVAVARALREASAAARGRESFLAP